MFNENLNSRFNNSISEEFVEIIAELMEKDPAKRIGSCAEVVSRLEPFAENLASLPAQQLVSSPWSSPPLPGQEETLVEGDGTGSRSSQTAIGTDPLEAGSQETDSSQLPAAPPLALTDLGPTSIWEDSQTWMIVGISLAVGFVIGFLFTITLGGIF